MARFQEVCTFSGIPNLPVHETCFSFPYRKLFRDFFHMKFIFQTWLGVAELIKLRFSDYCNWYLRALRLNGELGSLPGWRIYREPLLPLFIHASKVVSINMDKGCAYNVIKRAICSRQDRFDIYQTLPCLFLNCLSKQLASRWVEWYWPDTKTNPPTFTAWLYPANDRGALSVWMISFTMYFSFSIVGSVLRSPLLCPASVFYLHEY